MTGLVFIALICAQDLATGRWDRDCGGYEERAASVQDCRDMATWLSTTSPAGVRVIRFECFRAGERAVAMATGGR
jgi:hypothetical protein